MQDSLSVITDSVHDVEALAKVMDLSKSRTYEILSKDNPYPKGKKLIRDIHASQGKESTRLIKADMDSLFKELLGEESAFIDVARLHKESCDVVQSILENKPREEKMRELRELIALAQESLICLEKEEINRVYIKAV